MHNKQINQTATSTKFKGSTHGILITIEEVSRSSPVVLISSAKWRVNKNVNNFSPLPLCIITDFIAVLKYFGVTLFRSWRELRRKKGRTSRFPGRRIIRKSCLALGVRGGMKIL